jgi:hypothetical protein
MAGETFWRLGYSGAGLSWSLLAADRRCHVLSIAVTAGEAGLRDTLTATIAEHLSFDATASAPRPGSAGEPRCITDYATAATVLEPAGAMAEAGTSRGGKTRLPARLIIAPDGTVAHVHAIAGSPAQRRRVTAILEGWRFTRPQPDDTAVETGVTIAPD